MSALDEVCQKFPDRYVDNYVMLARAIRLEADMKHSMAKRKTVDEALAELESRVGQEGRPKFEKAPSDARPRHCLEKSHFRRLKLRRQLAGLRDGGERDGAGAFGGPVQPSI